MAISKILHMKDSGNSFHARHLKRALDYVMNPEKTQRGRLVGAVNCQADMAFEQMMDTKKQFGKTDKRQGYHIILSFKEDEVEPDRAFEITQKFVAEYLGDAYEAVFVVHDNTDHVHSHIVFNSVSFVDGKKYRYEKGDWAKYIQPITNKLCQEYGLSIIDVDDGSKEKEHESYKDWSEYREGSFVWADMIKRDLDSCILQAGNYEQFLELLSDKGYEVKQGKYLAVRHEAVISAVAHHADDGGADRRDVCAHELSDRLFRQAVYGCDRQRHLGLQRDRIRCARRLRPAEQTAG